MLDVVWAHPNFFWWVCKRRIKTIQVVQEWAVIAGNKNTPTTAPVHI